MKFIIAATCTFLVYATVNYNNNKFVPRNVETELPGIYRQGSKSKYILDRAAFDFNSPTSDSTTTNTIPVTIMDARIKEHEENLSKQDFFHKHGFVIIDHKSAMSAKDWSTSDRVVPIKDLFRDNFYGLGDHYNKVMDEYRNAETPAKHIYAKEVEGMIRSVFPQTKEVIAPAQGLLRKAVPNVTNAPVKTMHTDYGFSGFDGLLNNIKYIDFHSHIEKYEEIKANEFMLVNFWRPVLPMSNKLRSHPLCFLDTSTVHEKDQVTVNIQKDGQISTNNLYSLKENPRHEFYYYPDMTTDEVVIFKQFHQLRNESTARMPTFHTSFVDPAADEETEGRISFEYRVAILS
mmetsp:Transcript_11262/g.12755  ORF Transcript_11262/g.12755 Transcript_11262/m.12755 type:complete len:347 (-) Transcript_11262:57-1097(-)